MGIVEDAKKELDLIGFGERESRVMTDILRQFVHTFDSGGAFAAAAPVLKRLLDGKPLTPLTGEPDEWVDQSAVYGTPEGTAFQNRRYGTIFRIVEPDGKVIDFDANLPGDAEFPRGARITFPHEVR